VVEKTKRTFCLVHLNLQEWFIWWKRCKNS